MNIDIAGPGAGGPDGVIGLSDVIAALDAFQGLDRCCADTTRQGGAVVTVEAPTAHASKYQLLYPLRPEEYAALEADIAKRGVLLVRPMHVTIGTIEIEFTPTAG